MNRRLLYPIIAVVVLISIHFVLQPFLYSYVDSGVFTETEFRLYYFSANILVNIGIAVILYFEGRYNGGVQAVSGFIIANAVMDFTCIQAFPKLSIKSNVISTFAGIMIFAFGLVATKKAYFKKGAGVFFILLGAVYIIRFPMFMDVLFFYFKKYARYITAADGYYFGTLHLNYVILFLEILALDSMIRENIAMSRYTKIKM